jgi:hypothetical protein
MALQNRTVFPNQRTERLIDAGVFLESLTWLTAWLVLPIRLALEGGSFLDFCFYSAGAAFLVSIGIFLTNRECFAGWENALKYVGRCWLRLFTAGAACFGVAAAIA